jgi:hemolysin activation/secretion protein
MSHQSNHAYSTVRPHALTRYFYGRGTLQFLRYFSKDWQCFLSMRGQGSTNTLLFSETLGLGGFDTVRGYDERQVNVDNGFLMTLEGRFPSFSIIKKKDSLRALLFFDLGTGNNHHKTPANPKSATLIGVGPGLRYDLHQWLTARFDWGIQLLKAPQNEKLHQRVHFSVIGSY